VSGRRWPPVLPHAPAASAVPLTDLGYAAKRDVLRRKRRCPILKPGFLKKPGSGVGPKRGIARIAFRVEKDKIAKAGETNSSVCGRA
jgi:hypothetical protein